MGQISYSCVFLCSVSSGDGCCFPLDKSSGIPVFCWPWQAWRFCLVHTWGCTSPLLHLTAFNCCYPLCGVWILMVSQCLRVSRNLSWVPLAKEKATPAWVSLAARSLKALYVVSLSYLITCVHAKFWSLTQYLYIFLFRFNSPFYFWALVYCPEVWWARPTPLLCRALLSSHFLAV